jgi:molybdopterin/thiamine biosynthesis adenylyltransferase
MIDARHHRQRILDEVGESGQQRLRQAAVAIVGVGGLGSPVALYLAAAGVGRLGLFDDQRVELSNLNRQVLFEDCDVGRAKVEAAATRLLSLDASLQLDARNENVGPANVGRLFAEYDLVVDGTDSFETKFLLNDAAVLTGKPLVHGAVLQWSGQALTIVKGGPCLRCLFRDPPEAGVIESCEEAGVIGAACGVIGAVQAEEALKVLLGAGEPLVGRIFQHDGLRGEARVTPFPRDPDCPVCSPRASIKDLSRYTDQVSPRGFIKI